MNKKAGIEKNDVIELNRDNEETRNIRKETKSLGGGREEKYLGIRQGGGVNGICL